MFEPGSVGEYRGVVSAPSVSRAAGVSLTIVTVATAATAFGYVRLLADQGDWPRLDPRQFFVLVFLIGLAVTGGIGTVAHSVLTRAAAAAACSVGLLALGLLALFSIGLVLIIAGVVAAYAWLMAAVQDRTGASRLASAIAASATIAVLIIGLLLTG